MDASYYNARNLLLVTGERGVVGDGYRKIVAKLWAAALTHSVNDTTGINNDAIYHISVSAVCSADIAYAHIW